VFLWTNAGTFSGKSDAGGILYQTVTGNFSCDGAVHFADTTRTDLEGGIMVRASLDKDAPYVALTRHRSSGWFVRYRVEKGGRVISAAIASGTPLDYVNFAVRRVGAIVSLYAQTKAGKMRKLADCPVMFTEDQAFVGYVAWSASTATPGVLSFTVGGITQPDSASDGYPVDAALTTFDSIGWMNEWNGLAEPDNMGSSIQPALAELLSTGVSHQVVTQTAGSAFSSKVGPWQASTDGTGAIEALDRRGELSWQVNLSSDGLFVYEFKIQEARIQKTTSSIFPLKFFVDGEFIETRAITTERGAVDVSVIGFTPWLKAGAHTVRLVWDGSRSGNLLRVNTLSLHAIGGADEDDNGVADWIDRRLHLFNAIDTGADAPMVLTSPVSPAPFEGRARWPDLTSLSINGVKRTVNAGAGYRWFATIPLLRNAATTVAYAGENGAVTRQLEIFWTPHDVLSGGTLHLQRDSRLLVSVASDDPEVATLTQNGSPVALDASGVAEIAFASTGTFTLTGTGSSPSGDVSQNATTVKVYDAELSPLPGLVLREQVMTKPALPSGVILQADPRTGLATMPGNTAQIAWQMEDNIVHRIVARGSEDGPVLGAADMPGSAIYTTMDTYTLIKKRHPDGTQEVETLVILSPLRDDHSVKLEVTVAGVIFDNGLRTLLLQKEDFDELGQAKVTLFSPPGTTTSVCHRTQLFYKNVLVTTQ
jgi:hypothetical protein